VVVSVALLATVLLVGLIFVLDGDSWYLFFKALHVVAAGTWVDGGLILTLLAIRAERADDTNRLLQIGERAEWVGNRVYAPSSFLVLATGIATTINGDLDWGEFWIVFGLVAWGISTAIGIGYLTPKVKRFTAVRTERGPTDPEAQSLLRGLLLAARIDAALLLLIVIDMTVKRSAS
jgi:uncharacterized membrane protein